MEGSVYVKDIGDCVILKLCINHLNKGGNPKDRTKHLRGRL